MTFTDEQLTQLRALSPNITNEMIQFLSSLSPKGLKALKDLMSSSPEKLNEQSLAQFYRDNVESPDIIVELENLCAKPSTTHHDAIAFMLFWFDENQSSACETMEKPSFLIHCRDAHVSKQARDQILEFRKDTVRSAADHYESTCSSYTPFDAALLIALEYKFWFSRGQIEVANELFRIALSKTKD